MKLSAFFWIAFSASILLAIADASGQPTSDLYWICFSGDDPADSVFLMQIDAEGDVTIRPKRVVRASRLGNKKGASALGTEGNTNLHLWVWGENSILHRFVIEKSRLRLKDSEQISHVKTADTHHLHVTQRPGNNFLLVERPTGVLRIYPVDTDGLPTGDFTVTASQAPRFNDDASISPDGLMLISSRHIPNDQTSKDRVYALPLDNTGQPTALKKIAAFRDMESNDVTDPLAGGNRFVVYVVDEGTIPDDQLMLQVIASNGAKVGNRIVINRTHKRNADFQNVAIDPLGRFLVFTVDGADYNCPNKDVLVYQALLSSGQPDADLKLIAGCGRVAKNIVNIDMLKE